MRPSARKALARVAAGLPLFGSQTTNAEKLFWRRVNVRYLYDEGYIVRGKWGPCITPAGRAALTPERQWTEVENDTLRALYAAEGPGVLAERLGRTPRAVKTQARKLGVRIRGRKAWTEADRARLRESFEIEGPKALAEELRRGAAAIRTEANRMGLRYKELRPWRPQAKCCCAKCARANVAAVSPAFDNRTA